MTKKIPDKLGLAVLKLLMLTACTAAVPPLDTPTALPNGRLTPIFVTAARQKAEVKPALAAAGFRVVDALSDDALLLRATIGIDQGEQACGTMNNVRLQLRRESNTVAEVAGKGWTGSCQPNILDELSRKLWRQLFDQPLQ
ncbi:hypothetical protein [Methylomonas koyamae]|uniref:Uncharacterized protein n=1 Tax=Methylomonas koyamae TaxID=702114 RepID=A0A291IJY6_9GAMM|nr:hypothetical protein [Methylomonas koyamae]ATG90653.1 hypothetical protein MKLM6_2432 [Methylomonas koyamae]OAI22274.1 hypothetical protein A1356_02470 [Methylomonas koyamae]